MDEKKQEMMERIGKLLLLAADQDGKPEGENARAMASKLMAKYRIAESEVDLKAGNSIYEDKEGWEGLTDEFGKVRQWVSDLGSCLAKTFDCSIWRSPSTGTLHFIGTSSDIETVLYFMDVLYNHIEGSAWEVVPQESYGNKRNIFGQSAVMIIRDRLNKMYAQMAAETAYQGGNALVVVKNELVAKTASDIFKERGFVTSRNKHVKSTMRDASIIAAGIAAGKSAPLNKAIGN